MKATNNPIYLSDILSAPNPRKNSYYMDRQRRKILSNLVWGVLPYLIQGAFLTLMCGVCMFGVTALALSFGG